MQYAIKQKQTELIPTLLSAGANPDQICKPTDNRDSLPPLLLAINQLDIATMERLIQAKAGMNGTKYYTVLGIAIAGNNYSLPYRDREAKRHKERRDIIAIRQAVGLLIEANAPINVFQTKAAPLHWALVFGDEALVDMLLKAGADPNLEEQQHKRTPLSLSIAFNYPQLTKRLLSNNPPADISGVHGLTALLEAARQKNTAAIEELIKAGVNIAQLYEQPLLHRSGRTIRIGEELFKALRQEDEITLQALIKAGADINRPIKQKQGRVMTGLLAHDLEKQKKGY